MDRRAFLATSATAIALPVAGCSEPTGGALSMEPMNGDSAIARRYAGSTANLSSDRRSLVDAAIAGETPTRTGRFPPYERSRPLEDDGEFYEITVDIADSRAVTRYVVRIDYDPEREPSSAIAYEDLPEADRLALAGQVPPGDDPPSGDGFDLDSTYRYPLDADSVLAPDQQYDGITYEGETYRLEIEADREVTVRTYEYDAVLVAESADALGRQLRERYLFTLTDLSEEQQSIVEEATRTYRPEDEVPEAFRSLSEEIRSHDAIEIEEDSGTWLVRYEGSVYWTNLEYPPETDV